MYEEEEEESAGTPAWMATFADLMSLLMCFFVLLLSFSEMDVEKFKQIAGSMQFAFGVQRQINLDDIPLGTSVVATEFAPGVPDETEVETIQQESDQNFDPTLEITRSELSDSEVQKLLEEKIQSLLEETASDAEKLQDELKEEIDTGKIDVESEGRVIIVRVRENGSFPSGSALLATEFLPTIARIRNALSEIEGTVSVEGHTDNVPLVGGRYESNWGLSASRALSVTHQLIASGELDEDRMMVTGFADTRPFTLNDTPEGRAMNRRVEIVIRQGLEASDEADIEALKQANPEAIDVLGLD